VSTKKWQHRSSLGLVGLILAKTGQRGSFLGAPGTLLSKTKIPFLRLSARIASSGGPLFFLACGWEAEGVSGCLRRPPGRGRRGKRRGTQEVVPGKRKAA
jgi:hypothetical protein